MKCNICNEKIDFCENCNGEFERGDDIWCDREHQGGHFCSGDCYAEFEDVRKWGSDIKWIWI